MPPIGRLLLWILLAAAIALLVTVLARHALKQRRPDDPEEAPPPEAEPGAAAPVNVVETDVARLLELARAAAAAGDFGKAIEAAYAALLRKLEGANLVRVEADRTNGDHLRDLARAQPELRPPVAAVVAEVERVEFGGEPPTEERFRFVHDRVMGLLVQRMGPLLLLFGLATMLAGCPVDRGGWERAPDGRGAVVTLLQKYGFEAKERWAGLEKLDEKLDQLLLVPGARIDEEGWKALHTWVSAGHTLIVSANRDLPAWLGETSTRGSAQPMTLDSAHIARFAGTKLALPVGWQLSKPRGRPLVRRGPEIYVSEWDEGDGRVVLFADDQLFNNIALLPAENARFFTDLMRPGGKHVEMAGELTGQVAHDPVTSVRRGKLAPALIQLALLALVFFAYKGTRFGRAVDPITGRRRTFSEHARALGLKYARARATRYGLELYGAYALERLRERLNLGSERSLSAMAEAIAARTGRPLGDVMRVLVQAREATAAPTPAPAPPLPGVAPPAPPPPSPDDLAAVRQLASLLAQTGGSGERSRLERKI
jgi:hypothetical protein